jgi:hypothetical protein
MSQVTGRFPADGRIARDGSGELDRWPRVLACDGVECRANQRRAIGVPGTSAKNGRRCRRGSRRTAALEGSEWQVPGPEGPTHQGKGGVQDRLEGEVANLLSGQRCGPEE